MRKALSFLLALCLVVCGLPVYAGAAAVSGSCGDNLTWKYEESTKTLTITGSGDMTAWVSNPPWYNLISNTGGQITEHLILEEGITSISYGAFSQLRNVEEVVLPGTLQSIGRAAFSPTYDLKRITLSEGLTTIECQAFFGATLEGDLILPSTVLEIGTEAFRDCMYLNGVSLPNGLITISEDTFYNSNIKQVYIPASVKTIEPSAFAYCAKLVDVYYGGTEAQWQTVDIKGKDSTNIRLSMEEVTFHYNATGLPSQAVKPTPSPAPEGPVKIKRLYPENGGVALGSIFEIEFDREIAESPKQQNVADNEAGSKKLGIYGMDGTAIFECNEFHHSKFVLSGDRITVRFSDHNTGVRMKEGEKYYIVMEEGFFHFTDGSVSPAIEKGEWEFTCGGTKTKGTLRFHFRSSGIKGTDLYYSGLPYDDEWFKKDSTAHQFRLAQLSAGFVYAGCTSAENTAKPYANGYDFLEQMGFAEETLVNIGHDKEDSDTIGMIMGTKILRDGKTEEPLLAICLRGSDYGAGGWAGNFKVGESGAYHEGFNRAAEMALAEVKKYIAQQEEEGRSMKGLRIWLTGYSRSAATANLLSAKLREKGVCAGNRIFTYTFATPNNQYNVKGSAQHYSNIFNYVNPSDAVPLVPLNAWGFGKQGTTYLLPKLAGSYMAPVQAQYSKLTSGQSYVTPQHNTHLLTWMTETVTDAVPDRAAYYRYIQPILVKAFDSNNPDALYEGFAEALNCRTTDVKVLFTSIRTMVDIRISPGVRIAAGQTASAMAASIAAQGANYEPYAKLFLSLGDVIRGAVAELTANQFSGTIRHDNLELLTAVANLIEKNEFNLIQEHYAETYFTWMMSISEDDLTIDTSCHAKIAVIRCPVDVEVYDSQGNLAAKVEDNVAQEVSGSKVTAAVYGTSDKVIVMPKGQDYTVKITATGSGTMDYSVYESAGDNCPLRTVSIHDIPLAVGDIFDGKVDSAQNTPNRSYALTRSADKKGFYPDYDSSGVIQDSLFADVKAGDWYYDAVKFVTEAGLMNGVGEDKFAPGENLSRAMLAQVLFNKEGKPMVIGGHNFKDVQDGQWYTTAIIWASNEGIVKGYPGGLFGTGDNITREQLATMLWRYLGEPKAAGASLSSFRDAGKVSGYASDAMKWAVKNGVINGKGDGILDPGGFATRAEVAQMLKNYWGKTS